MIRYLLVYDMTGSGTQHVRALLHLLAGSRGSWSRSGHDMPPDAMLPDAQPIRT